MQRALTGETFDDKVFALVIVPVDSAHARVTHGELEQVALDEIARNTQCKTEGGSRRYRIR